MNLQELRERVNKSKEEVAYRLKVTSTTIWSWEKGKNQPTRTLNDFFTLAEIYSCTLEELRDAINETWQAREINENDD